MMCASRRRSYQSPGPPLKKGVPSSTIRAASRSKSSVSPGPTRPGTKRVTLVPPIWRATAGETCPFHHAPFSIPPHST